MQKKLNYKNTVEFPELKQLSYETKNKEIKPIMTATNASIEAQQNTTPEERQQYRQAMNNYAIAKVNYDQAKVDSEESSLFDKTLGVPIRAVQDLLSPFTTGESSYVRDEDGKITFMPSYTELKQQKVREDTPGLLGIGQDIVYGGTKILGAAALDTVTAGIGGKALYWSDMGIDNYKNVINKGYSKDKALLNTAISTGSEFLTEKLLGGVSSKLTGGKASQMQNLFANTLNKQIKNPKIASLLGSMGSEGVEEFLQEYIGALNDYVTLGEEQDLSKVIKDSFYSALIGAGSAGLVNTATRNIEGRVVNDQVNNIKEAQNNLQSLKETTTNEKTLNKIDDSIQKAQEFIDKPFGKDYEGAIKNINTDTQGILKLLSMENTQTTPQTSESMQDNINIPQTEKTAETGLNKEIELPFDDTSTRQTTILDKLNENERQSLNEIYRKTSNNEQLTKQEVEQLQYLRRKANDLKNPELKTDNTFEDLKQDYGKYYKSNNLEKYDNSMLLKAEDTIAANKQGKRTKAEWLDVAKNIGQQAENLDSESLKRYAFESFKDASPNQSNNLNRQGQKYVKFGIDEWVNAVYEGAGVGQKIKVQPSMEKVQSSVESKTQETNNEIKENILSMAEKMASDPNETKESFVRHWYNKQNEAELGITKKQIEDIYDKKANVPELKNNDVIKIETTGEKGKQYFKDNGADEKVAEILSEKPKIDNDATFKEKIKKGTADLKEEYQWFKRKFVDKGETIYRLAKKLKNNQLYAKYDKMGTSVGEANYQIGKGQTNLDGKVYKNFVDSKGNKTSMSLNKIWEGIDPKIANEYLAHQLNIDRYNQTNETGEGKYVFGQSVTDKISKQKVTELEKAHPELKRFGQNVWQYGKNQLQNMVDAGLVSQQQANQFMKETPHYVRLQRNVDSSPRGIIGFDKNGKAVVNKQIQEFKGSNLDILPFKDSMAQQTLNISRSIRTNLFAQELANSIGMGTQDNSIKSIDDNFGINPELIKQNSDGTYSLTLFNKGVATTIPINEGIYEALQPNKHYNFEEKLPFKGIRKIDNFRKALLTDKNPLFLATNMMKDAFDAPLNSKHPLLFAKNYIRAIKEIATNGKYYQQYQALGGLQNTYFDHEGFQKEGSKLNPFTWIEKGNNAIEQFPRLAEFISTIDSGGTIDEAMYNAAEITTNFKRGGDVSKALNRNGATFLNASIQGFSKQIRNFTDIQNPKQAVQLLGKIVALGIAPAMINDAMYDDDEEYQQLQDYQKDNYYLFKGINGNWIRIPKGRAVSIFQSAARRTKYALSGQENAFEGFLTQAANQIAPNNPFENNIISPFVDVARNESWSGNPIVSDSIKNPEHPEEEYTPKTDELSKWLGKVFNASPAKINYILDQYSGVLGDITLPALTKKAESENDDIASKILLNPIKDKFTTNAILSNKSQSEFYDAFEKAKYDSKWSKSTPIDNAKYNYLYGKNLEISDVRKQMTEMQASDKSDAEKYKFQLEKQKEINKISTDALKDIKNMTTNEYYIKLGDSYYKKIIKDGKEKYVKDTSKKIPTESYALYDYFKEKYEKSKESD